MQINYLKHWVYRCDFQKAQVLFTQKAPLYLLTGVTWSRCGKLPVTAMKQHLKEETKQNSHPTNNSHNHTAHCPLSVGYGVPTRMLSLADSTPSLPACPAQHWWNLNEPECMTTHFQGSQGWEGKRHDKNCIVKSCSLMKTICLKAPWLKVSHIFLVQFSGLRIRLVCPGSECGQGISNVFLLECSFIDLSIRSSC